MNKFWDCLGLVLYCGLIYSLSSQSVLPAPMFFSFQDKLHHAGAFFIMGYLAWRGLRHWISQPIVLGLVSVVFCSLYGATDEWHQSFVVGRHADRFDWVADTLGAGLAIWLIHQFQNRQNQHE